MLKATSSLTSNAFRTFSIVSNLGFAPVLKLLCRVSRLNPVCFDIFVKPFAFFISLF